VRFLQNNVIAYQDQAWGDGDIFADYKCSPGIAVDRYRDRQCYRILISLRSVRNAGDEENLHIERTIHNGFSRAIENFQTNIDHSTQDMSMSIVFPKKRHPSFVSLLEQDSQKVTMLDSRHFVHLPDGQLEVKWSKSSPQLYEAYALRWVW
jgi:hypothetical protein